MITSPRHAARLTFVTVAVVACLALAGCASRGAIARAPEAPAAPSSTTTPLAYSAATPAQRAFVDTLERVTFQWFWDTADPTTGLTPDRWPTKSFASVAAMGFGLAAYPVGVERGWVSREAGAKRTYETLRFLYEAPMDSASTRSIGYRGFYYHFLHPHDGTRFEKLELSFIDTGLLVAGALFCG